MQRAHKKCLPISPHPNPPLQAGEGVTSATRAVLADPHADTRVASGLPSDDARQWRLRPGCAFAGAVCLRSSDVPREPRHCISLFPSTSKPRSPPRGQHGGRRDGVRSPVPRSKLSFPRRRKSTPERISCPASRTSQRPAPGSPFSPFTSSSPCSCQSMLPSPACRLPAVSWPRAFRQRPSSVRQSPFSVAARPPTRSAPAAQ